MLRIYARCLKELHRKDEFMRVMLSLLTKVVARTHSNGLPRVRFSSVSWLDEEAVDVRGCLEDIVNFSEELPYNFTATLTDFFDEIYVNPEIGHFTDRDGFQLRIQFRHLLSDDLALDRIRIRLVKAGVPTQEIWMEASDTVLLRQGLVKTTMQSNVSITIHT